MFGSLFGIKTIVSASALNEGTISLSLICPACWMRLISPSSAARVAWRLVPYLSAWVEHKECACSAAEVTALAVTVELEQSISQSNCALE